MMIADTGPFENAIVFVVDDDEPVRYALNDTIESVGLKVQLFGSTREFLCCSRPDAPTCLVLDVKMPETSGLDLQREKIQAKSVAELVKLADRLGLRSGTGF